MFNLEDFAGQLYERYCQAVGGKAYDGKPLPLWKEFRGDESKRVQSDAWVRVAESAYDRMVDFDVRDSSWSPAA